MNFHPIMPGIGDLFPPMYPDSTESPSLEETTRNIPLWLWADKEIGGSFNSSTTNNNRPVTISPSFNIKVGDEKLMDILFEANPSYIYTVIFPANVALNALLSDYFLRA